MQTFNAVAAQGELYIMVVDNVPADATPVSPVNSRHVVSHSRSGHHHVMGAHGVELFQDKNNPLRSYLRLGAEDKALVHLRENNQHEPLLFRGGRTYLIIHDREMSASGWRRVDD